MSTFQRLHSYRINNYHFVDSGHADINANSLPEDEEDVEYDYEYEYSTGILPTQNNHQDHEYVLNNSHHSTYTTNGRLLPRDNIIDETDSGFMAVRSSTLNHNSTPLSEELAQSLHSEFEEISATEVDNQFSAPPSQLRQGGRAHRHWSTSTKRAELNSSTETASIEDAPRGPGEGEESPLEEVRLSPKLHRPKKLESETIIEEGSQETNLLKDPQRLYKVVFVGDSYVGKTSLMHRVCNDAFHDGFNATIAGDVNFEEPDIVSYLWWTLASHHGKPTCTVQDGVDFQVKTMSVKGNSVAIQLWDTAGQERFRSITRHYFRKSDAVIVVYDVTSEKSFLSVRNWMTSIEEVTDEHVVRVIIGNKVDLEDLRQVQKKRGEEIAGTYQSLFYEASAKSGVNVADCIEELAHKLLEKEDREMEEALKLINEVVAKKKCCRS
ncbi:Ras-related protein Rab-8B [Holothuria leucospilota]|uniref:Ras-related protein Rab-8B n=1 Tax=Holothuria leucospilota TaxID=206669 RepID=A0A9Q1CP86_HOLLE|nr:Ras-related protein Rab-8B [Holothuria leucospilota]